MSKDSLVKGTIILTVAALVARFLGVFQRIPLVYLLGDEGMGSYAIAFNLYSVLLVVATAGIPSALSKMIAERTALGRDAEAARIYRTTALFAVGTGVVAAIVLFVLSPWYAGGLSEDPKAILATQAIAPALIMFPLIAVMRGYFQGRRHMMPNGVSQVIEQIFRLVFAVGLAYLLLSVSEEWAIAGASFGGVVGGAAALGVMVFYMLKLRKEDAAEKAAGPASRSADAVQDAKVNVPVLNGTRSILTHTFKLSIPIVIFSITVTLIYTIDSSSVVPLLRGEFGYEGARELNGILGGRAQSLAGLPIILAIALSQSVVPLISSTYSQGKLAEVGHHTARVMQLAVLSGLPMVLLVAIGARPIDGFIFGYEKSIYGYENGPWIIALLTVSAMFQIIMQTSGAVLMGIGKMKPLMIAVGVGIAVKLALNYTLGPWLGIYGIVAATGACFVVMSIINLRALRQDIAFVTMKRRRWAGLTATVAIIAVVGLLLERVTHLYVHLFAADRLNEGLNAVIVCGVVLAMYPVLLLATKTITRADAAFLPGPLRRLAAKGSKSAE